MKTKPSIIIKSAIIILVFLLSFYGKKTFTHFTGLSFPGEIAATIYFYSWWIIPTVLTLGFLFGFRNIFKVTGLQKDLLTGLLFALLTVWPMFTGSAIIGEFNSGMDWGMLFRSTFLAGFMEEYLFRGFLFGILFRKLGWGFIPAGIIGAVFFGSGHIYQGSNAGETIGIFIITAMGSLWFAWLFIEWRENLWIPVFLHILMNLSWGLFDISDNAMGGIAANIFRIATIALTIVITIFYHRKSGLKIRKNNLIVNKRSLRTTEEN
jgi:uncharacterized protein